MHQRCSGWRNQVPRHPPRPGQSSSSTCQQYPCAVLIARVYEVFVLLCPLCDRALEPEPSVDEHHLVLCSQGSKAETLIHRICHRKIHATLTERALAAQFNSWQALQARPEIAIFVRWVANKPAAFYDNSRRPARRR